MVEGIEKFKAYFSGHDDKYTIIGGAACDLVFQEAGLPFRATKDIDMVLCVEVVDVEFGEAFKSFLDAGGYQAREQSEGNSQYFRFHKPTENNFPFMIELFSRKSEIQKLSKDAVLAKIPVEQNVLSLSAILLNDDYFEALLANKRTLHGLTIIDETLLIPFKARAFLDLSQRLESGEKIDSKVIKKHRNDVFRLAQLLTEIDTVKVSTPIREDLKAFLQQLEQHEPVKTRDLNIQMPYDAVIELIRRVYGLDAGATANNSV